MPAAENVTVGVSDVWLENVAVPGPLTLVQFRVICAGGDGCPSSVAVAASVVVDGNVIVRSAPELTTGAALGGLGLTTIVTSSLTVTAPSLTVSRST